MILRNGFCAYGNNGFQDWQQGRHKSYTSLKIPLKQIKKH